MTDILIFIAFILVAGGLLVFFLMKNRKKKKEQEAEEPVEAPVVGPVQAPDAKEEEQVQEPTEQKPEPAEPEAPQEAPVESVESVDLEKFNDITEEYLSEFMNVDPSSKLFMFIRACIAEAWYQFYKEKSIAELPTLYLKENFPAVIDYYGVTKDEDQAFKAMACWIIALVLTEFFPDKRNEFMTVGYNLGGDKDDPIYAYEFHSDRNIARLVGASVWAAMRSKFDIEDIKASTVGTSYNSLTVHKIAEDSFKANRDTFFIDLTNFLPPTPGPYLNGYTDRTKAGGYPWEGWNGILSDHNTKVDSDIYSAAVNDYNLENSKNFEKTVQAIADKEADPAHMFGDKMKLSIYEFNPVYGESNIGKRISPDGKLASFAADVWEIGSMSRKFMMEDKRYGRRRPGQKDQDGISKDGRDGVLCNFDIENNDGCPGEYNKNGEWVRGEEQKPGEYCAYSKRNVYANSYPSGHSSGMMNVCLLLTELMPERADKILRATNEFAVGRTIARYHWNSDTIIGRVLGSATAAVTRATRDFKDRLEEAKSEV